MRLYAVDKEASSLGLFARQALTDARAMVPALIAHQADPSGDGKAFGKLCEWHTRYSPLVTPYEGRDILIDITGSAHLFGGEEAMLDEALAKLANFGVEARGAIADTAGAAWAGAHSRQRLIISPEMQKDVLANLPVAALRLEQVVTENLKRLGLKSIRQLYDLPRAPLAARFSKRLNERLDQMLGRAPEPLTPLAPAPDYSATRNLAEPISTEESILFYLGPLAGELQETLARDGKGGRRFELSLYRVDNAITRLEVRTSAPTRKADHMIRLITNKLQDFRDDFDAGFGFEVIRLAARECDPLSSFQAEAFSAALAKDADSALIDRLSNRLGARNVVRFASVDSHLPERTVSYAPALTHKSVAVPQRTNPQRPLQLLPRPEEITVIAEVPDGPPLRFKWRRVSYRAVKTSGPERIEDEWWRGSSPPARDYYRVETPEGWRFWMFRAGLYGRDGSTQWYLHGFFP